MAQGGRENFSQGIRMGTGARLRSDFRRLSLWYRTSSDGRKQPLHRRCGRDHQTGVRLLLKRFLLLAVLVGTGMGFFRIGKGMGLLRPPKERPGNTEEYLETIHGPDDGKREQYDPMARVFIDPKMWQTRGKEKAKGREKRRLFLRVQNMSQDKGRPQPSLSDLMALPSSFDPSEGESDTTIILNQWKRTTLEQQLDAILEQSVRPKGGVWVCLFASPRERENRLVVRRYRDKFKDRGGLFLVASSFNFKYYGRFQMALQARTRYVWIIDDDVMPGNLFLQQLSHVAGIPEAEGADGSIEPMALGSVGWIMPRVQEKDGKFYSYRDRSDGGGLFLPDKRYGIPVSYLQEVDLLCSHWFIETDWVKLLFREKWETPETGEDYMLAYALRKYAGVRSYVLPMDLTDSQTWGNLDVKWDMQHQGGEATTRRSMVPVRDMLWHRLLKRGGEFFMSEAYALHPRPLLLVVDNLKDAEVLRPLFLELQSSMGGSASPTAVASPAASFLASQRPPRVALTGRSDLSCSKAAEVLGNAQESNGRGAVLCNFDSFSSAWDLLAGRHYPREGTDRAGGSGGRDHALMADLTAGLAGTVETLRPLAIVSVAGSGYSAGPKGEGGGGAAIDEALAVVTAEGGVPLVRLPRTSGSSGAARWLSRLSEGAFGSWHQVRVDILVLYNPARAGGTREGGGHTEAQLLALLDSLVRANYLGDKLDLLIALGSGRAPESVFDEKRFPWARGRRLVREAVDFHPLSAARSTEGGDDDGVGDGSGTDEGVPSAGLATLALRSWVPHDSDHFVVVIEADRVVSSLFYSWLKVAVLESNYGGGRRALQQQQKLQAPARGKHGLCVPGGDGNAWLFPPDYWKAEQARCLGAGDKGCEVEGRLRPPTEGSLCPSEKELSGVLVTRTDSDGGVVGEGGEELVENDETFADFVGRVFFHSN